MYKQVVRIAGQIDLVFGPKVYQDVQEKKLRYPHLPEPEQILADLRELGHRGGVPAVIREHNHKPTLLFYTDTYFLSTYPTERKSDGYSIAYIAPLDMREHERLSKGALMVQTPFWAICDKMQDLPGHDNHWPLILQAWQHLEERKRQAALATGQVVEKLTRAHERYLNTISTLVDVTHKLEQDQEKLPVPIIYREVEAAAEERFTRDIYTFILSGSVQVNEKNMLRLKGEADLQGRVLSLKGNRLTVKFESAIDRLRIRDQGEFEPIISGAIYRTRQEAIDTLRAGESKNPYLLRVLVDREYQRYQRDPALPVASLNTAQLEAFQRALTVPDMLMVLGPPGTGKTRTITEIVRQCSLRHQRVLVTSGTHKAVDNVLKLLPENLLVVRFGHEDRVSPDMRSRLIDERAKEMKQHIIDKTAGNEKSLRTFLEDSSKLDQFVQQLTLLSTQLIRDEQHLQDVLNLRAQAIQRIEAPYRPQLQAYTHALQEQRQKLTKLQQNVARWTTKRDEAAKAPHTFPQFFFRWRSNVNQKKIERDEGYASACAQQYNALNQEYAQLAHALQTLLEGDPEYQRCETGRRQIEYNSATLLKSSIPLTNQLKASVQHLMPLNTAEGPSTGQTLQQFTSEFQRARPLLEKRAKLLQAWRGDLETHSEQVTPELLRYADVVGATCIGAATAKGLTDIEFDLAIVDEAGQIALPDLLVPLVRARRSILVGDHKQLPPFVDSGVQTWLNGLSTLDLQTLGMHDDETDSQRITSFLTTSAFEQLFTERAHPEHIVRFVEQHRMPQIIANFASYHFYEQQLLTGDPRNLPAAQPPPPDPLFQQALAFIDTSGLSQNERRDEKQRASENWGITGFSNRAEAALIERIAALYEQEHMQWLVIVPYRAQAEMILKRLQNNRVTQDLKLEERVATIDSFQGGECDKVIYGFTRSNDYGGVGFLKELRRLNVAITRAKQQLVLVGDLSTLTNADDDDFARLARSLQTYARQYGELLSYRECQNRLARRIKREV